MYFCLTKMNKLFILLITLLLVLNEATAKNSTKTSTNSKSSKRPTKQKDRLPNRQGSLTRDSIFGELLNNKAGPPRKKRVRTILPTIDLSAPSFSLPTLNGNHFLRRPIPYQQPYAYPLMNHQQFPPLLPYQHLPHYWPRHAHTPTPYRTHPLPSASLGPPNTYAKQEIMSGTNWPTINVRAKYAVSPYYLFSKCAGLQEFPEILGKIGAQFSILDENKNGLLSQDEWERDILKQLENTNSGVNKLFVEAVFNLVDKDANNAMDFKELLEVADVVRANKDGAINILEFQLFWLKVEISGAKPLLPNNTLEEPKDLEVMSSAFNLLDENHDNSFTYTEFLQLDLDRDGEVGFLEMYYFLFRLSFDVQAENQAKVKDKMETDYVSEWLNEANRLPLKMLKLSFTKFEQADIDFNGALDSLEYLRLKESVIVAYSQESHKLLFDLNDINGDGYITVEEHEALTTLAQKEVNESSTGNVKFGQFRKKEDCTKDFPRVILNSDTNGDEKISKEEYIAQTEASIKCIITENNIQLISDILSFDMEITL